MEYIIILIYAMLIEYSVHRWLMHLPNPYRTQAYIEHAIEHHGKGRLDLNIEHSPLTVLIFGSPLFFGCFFFGSIWAVVVLISVLSYTGLWSILHNSEHDLGYKWMKYLPLYKTLRHHHLMHHKYPNKNFGTIFWFSDYIFGTAVKNKD